MHYVKPEKGGTKARGVRRWARIRRRGRGRIGKESRSRRGGARNARAFVSLHRAKRKGAEVGCEGPQMHLPQSLLLHRINGFARFFHGFISVFLLHSGHTSKPQFFRCFSIVSRVLYAIINFPRFTFILLGIIFQAFYSNFPFFSHCFMSYSLIVSIVFLIIFPSIAISPSPARRTDQGGIDTPPSPNCHLAHNPKKVYLVPPFLPPNFAIFDPLRALCPQTP